MKARANSQIYSAENTVTGKQCLTVNFSRLALTTLGGGDIPSLGGSPSQDDNNFGTRLWLALPKDTGQATTHGSPRLQALYILDEITGWDHPKQVQTLVLRQATHKGGNITTLLTTIVKD